MRYYPTLIRQLKSCLADPAIDRLTRAAFQHLVNELESDHCKRLIFDARQAKVFDESTEVDERRKEKIHAPFGFLYFELTEPILLKAQEPGCSDILWAFLYHKDIVQGIEVIDEGKNRRKINVTKLTFFYKSGDGIQFIDRTWSLSPEGYPLVGRAPKEHARRYKSGQGDGASGLTSTELLPDYVKEGELISIYDLKEWGWWEEAIASYTNLIYWMFAYTMAKSVEIIQLPVSRQIRRALEREGRIPNPWHVVRVEPRTIKGRPEIVGEGGIKHSYRYDVIGHLRFNRHKTKEGYRDTIEWVSDHQRGLENEIYIPKTYKVESDKKIAMREMQEYFDERSSEKE